VALHADRPGPTSQTTSPLSTEPDDDHDLAALARFARSDVDLDRAGLSRNLRTVAMIWRREMIRFWRNRTRLLTSFAQPLLYLFIFGAGLNRLVSRGATPVGVSFQKFLYPGVLAMVVLFSSIFSAISIVWDREFGFLREMLVAPVSRTSLVVGKALGGASTSALQAVVLLVLGPIIGVHLTVVKVLLLLPMLLLVAFAMTSIGVALAAGMASLESFQVVMQLVMMPMFFLSGAIYPVTGLPAWLSVLTRLDPLTYGVAPIRRLVLGDSVAGSIPIFGVHLGMAAQIAVITAIGVGSCGLAVHRFRQSN
jgi:ABC-2 type transport system permease protein